MTGRNVTFYAVYLLFSMRDALERGFHQSVKLQVNKRRKSGHSQVWSRKVPVPLWVGLAVPLNTTTSVKARMSHQPMY